MDVDLLFFNETNFLQSNSKSIETVFTLSFLLRHVLCYVPLIMLIFGSIGFVGNAITYLQPDLRTNTCCLYTFFGSIVDLIHLWFFALPDFLANRFDIRISWNSSDHACRFIQFLFIFLPNLSINFLVMSTIDRYACTCSLTSKMHRLNQMKVLPWTISLTIFISALSSIYVIPMVFLAWNNSCAFLSYQAYSMTNLIVNGFMPPFVMLIFVLLTYYNIHTSRRRVSTVGSSTPARFRNQFIVLIIAQVMATALISLQLMIILAYFLISIVKDPSAEQRIILYFMLAVSGYAYYLNNVKSFYVSLTTSRLFREKFFKGLAKIFPRYWSICGYEFINCQRR